MLCRETKNAVMREKQLPLQTMRVFFLVIAVIATFANHHFVDTDIEKPEQNMHEVEIRENARIGDLCIGAAFFIVVVGLAIFYSRRKTRIHREEIQRLINEIDRVNKKNTAGCAVIAANAYNNRGAFISGGASDKAAGHLRKQVMDMVKAEMPHGDLSVQSIASKLNMGEQTFRRRFFEETGMKPKVFIMAVQMEMAAQLLSEKPSMPICEIGIECGFEDASSFSNAFKKTYGCSPSNYRAK